MAGAASDIPTLDQTPSSSSSPSSATDNNKLYKGVRKRKWGKWVSEIRLPNSRERIWLGSYDSPEKAARAFDAALYCLRGRHANFNFPDTPFNLEINNVAVADQSLTPQEIQVVAAKFANEDPLPLDYHNQQPSQPQQPQRDGANSFGLLSKSDSITESTYTTTTASSSSTTMPMPMHEYDGTVQVDHGDMSKMDWTFLNVLDDGSNEVPVGSDYAPYSDLDKMHSGELLYSTLPPSSFEDNEDEIEGDDPFSHQSFLWNWNF